MLPGPLAAQWKGPPADSLQQLLTDRIAREGSTGLALGFVERGVPRVVTAGFRNGPGSPPIDAKTLFEIGSVSKVFTTTLLAEMAARGEVQLTDPIAKYLPSAVRVPSRNGREITLLDLATASSGLPRLPPLQPKDPGNPYADFTVDQLYSFLSGYALPRDPGASYEYSNLGMGLLGHVLALRAGKPYEELVIERILKPLGMNDTRIVLTPALADRFATGHDAGMEPIGHWDLPVLAGAGAWRSTPADMLKFLAACLKPPKGRLGEAIRAAMTERMTAGSPTVSIGMGWHITRREAGRMTWHNGGTGGFHSFVGLDLASGANVVVLSNAATDIDDIGAHLVNPSVPLKVLPVPRPVIAMDSAALAPLAGRYALAPGVFIEVTQTGSALSARVTGQSAFRIYPASPVRFFYRVVAAEIEFKKNESGAVTGLVLIQNGRETPAQRAP
jgi:CubicO group peptidase (beta-lactamase class C family)